MALARWSPPAGLKTMNIGWTTTFAFVPVAAVATLPAIPFGSSLHRPSNVATQYSPSRVSKIAVTCGLGKPWSTPKFVNLCPSNSDSPSACTKPQETARVAHDAVDGVVRQAICDGVRLQRQARGRDGRGKEEPKRRTEGDKQQEAC